MDEKSLDELMSLSLEDRWLELLKDVDELIQLEEDRRVLDICRSMRYNDYRSVGTRVVHRR